MKSFQERQAEVAAMDNATLISEFRTVAANKVDAVESEDDDHHVFAVILELFTRVAERILNVPPAGSSDA